MSAINDAGSKPARTTSGRPVPGPGRGRPEPGAGSVIVGAVIAAILIVSAFVWLLAIGAFVGHCASRGHENHEPAEPAAVEIPYCSKGDTTTAWGRCFVACSDADMVIQSYAPACANGGRDRCECGQRPVVSP